MMQQRRTLTELFGQVATGERHAVKFILLDSMNEKRLQEAGREIRNQWRCNHANVAGIKWVDIVRHKPKYQPREQTFLCIAMEYCERGELFNSVAQGLFSTEAEKRRIFAELVAAVEYLHNFLQICHRDLKLENVLLDRECHIKVCDFGVSKSEGFDSDPRSCVGTPAYCAPEVLHGVGKHAYNGRKADVWSLGVVLYILEHRQFPFGAEPDYSLVQVMGNIRNMRFVGQAPNRPEGVDNLIRCILTRDPERRLDLGLIWQHPWMQDVPQDLRTPQPNPSGGPMQSPQEAEKVFERAEKYVLDRRYNEASLADAMDDAFDLENVEDTDFGQDFGV